MKRFLLCLSLLSLKTLVFAQNVGIGTTSPNSSAILDLSSTTRGLLIPRMNTGQRTAIVSPTAGLIVFDTDFKEYYHHDGTSWRKLLNNQVWNTSTLGSYVYNSSDSIGIGTSSPDQKLHVNGGKIYLQDNRTNQNPHLIIDVPAVDYNEGGLQFQRLGDTLASINYVENPSYPNYLRLSADASGTAPSLIINTSGEVGLGTVNPLGKLHISSTDGNNIYINDADGIIQFAEPSLGSNLERGFIQLSDGDLRMGTNSGNTAGKFIVRTNGGDRIFVDGQGDVGIGESVPFTKLHIDGGQDADLSSSTNGYIFLGNGSGTNLLLDNNEIMARSGYSTPATLSLQNDGGALVVGAHTTINKDGEALKLNGVNPNIGFYQSGTFRSFIAQSGSELYLGVNNGRLHLDATQIAIGGVVAAASDYKLTVTGKAICEELKVKLSGNWPDYVFEKGYKKFTLPQLEQFIETNKHLPNIPKATELEANGIEVGDMQRRMMEKIEELTLYVIDLQKQIEALKKEQR